MAYIKIGSSKNSAACLTYGEYKNGIRRKNIIVNALNCSPESAKEEFELTRNLWNKNDGIQTHTIIQSFSDDDNITMDEANNIGLETAKKLFPAHQVVVYTHCDGKGQKKHNHIMINAVNFENGKKYDNHGLIYKVREISDDICKERGLGIIPHDAPTRAEKAIKSKGQKPWKDNLREILNRAKIASNNLDDFKKILKNEGIEINERNSNKENGKAWTYVINRPDWHLKAKNIKIRGRTLGNDYTCACVTQYLAEQIKVTQIEENKPVKNKNNSLNILKLIAEKHIDEAAKLYFADTDNKDVNKFMGLVINIHGTNTATILDTVQAITDIKDESQKYGANLLNAALKSQNYKLAYSHNGKGIWSDILDNLSGKNDNWADIVMYDKTNNLDDWNLKSEAEKDDIKAHKPMDDYGL